MQIYMGTNQTVWLISLWNAHSVNDHANEVIRLDRSGESYLLMRVK